MSRTKKGHAPTRIGPHSSKTRNQMSEVPLGTTCIDAKGYRSVKVARPNVWEQEHRVVLGLRRAVP